MKMSDRYLESFYKYFILHIRTNTIELINKIIHKMIKNIRNTAKKKAVVIQLKFIFNKTTKMNE